MLVNLDRRALLGYRGQSGPQGKLASEVAQEQMVLEDSLEILDLRVTEALMGSQDFLERREIGEI